MNYDLSNFKLREELCPKYFTHDFTQVLKRFSRSQKMR